MSNPDSTVPAGEPGASPDLAPELLDLLVCPLGKAELRLEGGFLVCTRCGPAFPIEDGIPIMLIDEARLPDGIERVEDLPCQREGAGDEGEA